MKQVFLSGTGQIEVFDVPIPARLHDAILVRNAYSLISTGTEAAAVTTRGGWLGVYEKVRNSKERVNQVWGLVQTIGVQKTWEMVRNKLEDYTMIGYSCAGQVVEVDHDELPFAVGQHVVCMGVGFANHAEYVVVPRNLAVAIPKDVSLEQAAFGALGCIALEGIRRLELTPGERVGVIGLGLIGQICVRLLDTMGYQVCGTDLSAERAAKAGEVQGVHAWALEAVDSVAKVKALTEGYGLDGVVVCAAAKSSDPVNLAFDLCRIRGRVSVIGDVGLDLQRSKMYKKEIELRLSCSYGPGRYDSEYELAGRDYPFAYVRWTERRNLEYFLDLLGAGRLTLRSLLSARYPVEQASTAYAHVKQSDPDTYGILLDYGPLPDQQGAFDAKARVLHYASAIHTATDRKIRVGLIGVGGYAKGVHIPNLKKLANTFVIHGLASRSGGTAAIAAKHTGALNATSDYHELLAEPEIDAVIISTRHASHARIVLDALDAGKHVFVEKPMATTIAAAQKIEAKASETGLVVRVGFNRRFSPYLNAMRRVIGTEGIRMFAVRVNIGTVQNDWSNTPEEGGRLLGEGVHFFDLCNWFIGAEPVSISAVTAGAREITNPNAMVHMHYPDGSTAQVLYTSLGQSLMGKEYFEAFGNGRAVRSDDYKTFKTFGAPSGIRRHDRGNKGQLAELEEFAAAIQGKEFPVEGADARAGLVATWMALAVYQSTAQMTHIELEI
jgi:predicted dehydrogenase